VKNDTKSKLDAIFQHHEAAKRIASQKQEEKETKEQQFLREFLDAREKIIRPAMQEVGEYVKAKGYNYEISTEDERIPADGRSGSTDASIRLTIFTSEKNRPRHEFPGLTAYCRKRDQRIGFHSSNIAPERGGSAGPAGDAALSEITADLIQEKLLKVVTEVFAR